MIDAERPSDHRDVHQKGNARTAAVDRVVDDAPITIVSPLCTTTVVSDSRVEKVGESMPPVVALAILAHLLTDLHVERVPPSSPAQHGQDDAGVTYWMFWRMLDVPSVV